MTKLINNIKEKIMGNDVAVKTNNALTTEQMNEWGAPVISAQDIILPKILPMQATSDLVTEGKANMGEFRDSLSGVLLGKIDAPFECIPFFVDKCWDIQQQGDDDKFKWIKTVPVVENPASPDYNDNWPWAKEEDGIKYKNIRRFNFYVLLPSEVAKGSSIPYIFSFKSTSMKEGKKLFSQMYMRNTRSGLPPAAYHVKIGGTREKNDQGAFIVPSFELAGQSTPEELAECLNWIRMIKGGRVKIDEADVQKGDLSAGVDTGTGDY